MRFLVHITIFMASVASVPLSCTGGPPVPRTFVVNGPKMQYTKSASSPAITAAKAAVVKAGDRHLPDPLWSVVTKPQTPASGSKHDYMSVSPYFWPNPNTANGLPYVNRDGLINPEFYDITDHEYLMKLTTAVGDLTAAYYFTGDVRYSNKAAAMIRAWFITPATRMNPNLKYTAIVKGVNTGSHVGIVEGSYLYKIVDAVRILQLSPSWTAGDQSSFITWSRDFYTWLTTSDAGKLEAGMAQNHGTAYQGQLAAFAAFAGNHVGVKAAVNKAKVHINAQIRSDGYQPLEMSRTRPFLYSTVNLEGLMVLARFGDLEGIDLWNYVAPSGGSIRKAINFLRPYALRTKPWNYSDLDVLKPYLMMVPFRQAATAYNDATFTADAVKCVQPNTWPEYAALMY